MAAGVAAAPVGVVMVRRPIPRTRSGTTAAAGGGSCSTAKTMGSTDSAAAPHKNFEPRGIREVNFVHYLVMLYRLQNLADSVKFTLIVFCKTFNLIKHLLVRCLFLPYPNRHLCVELEILIMAESHGVRRRGHRTRGRNDRIHPRCGTAAADFALDNTDRGFGTGQL